MRLSCLQILRANVDNIAANGLWRGQCKGQVLMHVVDTQPAFVDSTFINRPRLWQVHQLTETTQASNDCLSVNDTAASCI